MRILEPCRKHLGTVRTRSPMSPSPPHAGVGEPLELGPALRRDRRQPVGVACLVDRIGDAAATGSAFSVRAPLGDAGALAGGEEGAPVRLGREGPRRSAPRADRSGSADEGDRSAGCAGQRNLSSAPAADLARQRSGPFSHVEDAGQPRGAEAKKYNARPWQKRAPIERIRQRLAEANP